MAEVINRGRNLFLFFALCRMAVTCATMLGVLFVDYCALIAALGRALSTSLSHGLPRLGFPLCQCPLLVLRLFGSEALSAAALRYIILQSNFTSLPVSWSRPFAPRTVLMLPRRLRRVLSLIGFPSPRMRQASVIEPFQSSGMSGQVFRKFIV